MKRQGKQIKKITAIVIVSALCSGAFSAPYIDLVKNYNRAKSRVMARKVAIPTLANLDYAAYIANPMKYDPQEFTPKAPPKKVRPSDCTFGGLLRLPCASLNETPLTDGEKDNPVAWEPLQNRLWTAVKSDAFSKIGSSINGMKWADSSVYMPYQEIVAAYLHGSGDSAQVWVRIEFKPWVGFLEGMRDEAGDGFREIYGKLSLENIDKAVVAKCFEWIRGDYCKKILSRQDVVDWANVLASYWYPKLNTDMADMTGHTQWPNDLTEQEIAGEMHGSVIKDPLVVIRGNPLGQVIYNLFTVDSLPEKATVAEPAPMTAPAETSRAADRGMSQNFIENNKRFAMELKQHGDYAAWAQKDEAFRKNLSRVVSALPPGQMGFKGKDGWVFFRKDIDYLNGGDLIAQPAGKNPLPHLLEFQKYLNAHNISMLLVIVPNKSEVYYEKLPGDAPANAQSVVNPYSRKFLKDAQDSGVEVIDLLPLFLSAKGDTGEDLYQKQDTHWTTRGLEIAAGAIGQRIKDYGWYGDAAKTPVRYSVKDTVFLRQGDIVDKLAESDRTAYPAVNLTGRQVVNPDGSLFKPNNPRSPVLLIGDSFTGIFELVDCKAAGVGAHIAERTGLPVDIITSWGGGPLVREKALRARGKYLSYKRVVVYMMVARDLYNYAQGWEPLKTKTIGVAGGGD